MWSRFDPACVPSHRAVCATCVQLLPLIEMFCKWELQDDCSNLWELMLRFDSEAELSTHELGRSMLLMIRDDESDMRILSPRVQISTADNPFDAIRTRLAAIGTAFQRLQPQVHVVPELHFPCSISGHKCCHWAPISFCHHTGLCARVINVKLHSLFFYPPIGVCVNSALPHLPNVFTLSVLLFTPATPCCLRTLRHAARVNRFMSASPIQFGAWHWPLCDFNDCYSFPLCIRSVFSLDVSVCSFGHISLCMSNFCHSFPVCATCVLLPHTFEANRLFRVAFTQSHHLQYVAAAWVQRPVPFTLMPYVYFAFSSLCREQTECKLGACHYALPVPI